MIVRNIEGKFFLEILADNRTLLISFSHEVNPNICLDVTDILPLHMKKYF